MPKNDFESSQITISSNVSDILRRYGLVYPYKRMSKDKKVHILKKNIVRPKLEKHNSIEKNIHLLNIHAVESEIEDEADKTIEELFKNVKRKTQDNINGMKLEPKITEINQKEIGLQIVSVTFETLQIKNISVEFTFLDHAQTPFCFKKSDGPNFEYLFNFTQKFDLDVQSKLMDRLESLVQKDGKSLKFIILGDSGGKVKELGYATVKMYDILMNNEENSVNILRNVYSYEVPHSKIGEMNICLVGSQFMKNLITN